jgi:alkylhydroperoxidase family enzyme
LARQIGVSDETIVAAARGEGEGFSEIERVVIQFAEAVTRNTAGEDDELYAAVRAHFDDDQIIELLAAIGLFNYMNRFADTLRVEKTAR